MSIIKRIIKCPVCDSAIADSSKCNVCQTLSVREITKNSKRSATYIDFNPDCSDRSLKLESEQQKDLITQLFGNSYMPWFYEKILPAFWAIGLRGWGGIEKEALQVRDFFGNKPKIVMDLSCGTGIITRKLAKTGLYQHLIALDYSESMLKMLIDRIRIEETTDLLDLVIIRGDARSIPLISDSVDAIYAGAAMHCWSDPHKGVKEIYRVLRPGGKIFATTFTKFLFSQFLPSQEIHLLSIEELSSLFQKVDFNKELLEISSEGIYLTLKGNK